MFRSISRRSICKPYRRRSLRSPTTPRVHCTYNILQSDIADRLRSRKVENIESTGADVVAAGNIGCITQLATGTAIPVVHTVELIDWATGGPVPEVLQERVAAH